MTIKKFLKRSFLSFLALSGLMWLFPGFQVNNDGLTLIIAAFSLTIINLVIRPILKLILLPLNILSFGMFKWIINVLNLFLLTILINDVRFVAFDFPGFNQYGISLPAFSLPALGSLLAGSFLLTLIRKLIGWLLSNSD